MKIDFSDQVVETDKLTDKEAAIIEAINALHRVCQKFNVTSFTRVIMDDKNFLGQNTVVKNEKQLPKDFDFLLRTINNFIEKITLGQASVMRIKTDSD